MSPLGPLRAGCARVALRPRGPLRAPRAPQALERSDRLLTHVGPLQRPVNDLRRADTVLRKLYSGVAGASRHHEERDERNDGGRRRPSTDDAMHETPLFEAVACVSAAGQCMDRRSRLNQSQLCCELSTKLHAVFTVEPA